jgi:large subunit ribosomal protein L9
MMEIILREPIENLGGRGDVVQVANGYARNYLLPRKLALLVTESNRRQVERERVAAEAREAVERKDARSVAARIAAAECIIARRVGGAGTLYGSVTSADIAESLAGQRLIVDKRRIVLTEPIKELGDFVVPVRLHRDVTADLKVTVVQEGGDGTAEPESESESE